MSELRWHPILGEWVITATHRQQRTFLPPEDFCPFCPTRAGGFPTEVPEDNYDIAVFENQFPSLKKTPDAPAVSATELYQVRPSQGVCEVILYSPRHHATLADESVEQIYKLILVWTDRYRELGTLDFVRYVFIFENKGEAVGVTLHHPHGQIYAYPFVPPRVERQLKQSLEHFEKNESCLICDVLKEELKDARRIVAENDSFAAYVPFFARYPYEIHITSKRHLRDLAEFSANEQRDLAEILKQILAAYDALFELSFPYIMVINHRPTDGKNYDYYHFYIEFYPPMRSRTKFKYLAGSEAGAGSFINDTLPEEKAAELRDLIKPVEWKSDSKR